MKTTLLGAALAAALSIGAVAHAADPDNESVKISAPSAAEVKFKPQEFQDYLYTYALSNGDKLKFSQTAARYYAQIRGEAKVEIFPVASGQFVTDAGARIAFANEGDELTISNYERLPMTAQLPADTTVVALR